MNVVFYHRAVFSLMAISASKRLFADVKGVVACGYHADSSLQC